MINHYENHKEKRIKEIHERLLNFKNKKSQNN